MVGYTSSDQRLSPRKGSHKWLDNTPKPSTGLQGLPMTALIPVVDVEAALRAEALGVCDDDAAGAAAPGPGGIHHAVVVADVSAVDALHADGIAVPSDHHVWGRPAHDAV